MKLRAVTIEKFRNFTDQQRIEIESDVTGLIGKNESGKTTILQALYRLNPANGGASKFDLTTEYPRRSLSRDRRAADLELFSPVKAEFILDADDAARLSEVAGVTIPPGVGATISRQYGGKRLVGLTVNPVEAIREAAIATGVDDEDLETIEPEPTITAALQVALELSKAADSAGQAAKAKALKSFRTALRKYETVVDGAPDQEMVDLIISMMPKFFYFSNYHSLPGSVNLTKLHKKLEDEQPLTSSERTVIALLAHAGQVPEDFVDEDYASRKAELQAASADLSDRAFEYWRQNPDLRVVFDTDMPVVDTTPQGVEQRECFLMIEVSDERHGGVTTNFGSRSTGFQWFFSFFAAFSEYQESEESIIVLLDEPGTSLHGEAQKDFLRFIFEELGASKQTVYTTHSQHMIDPTQYEKLRTVHDRSTRQDPGLGVSVGPVSLSADSETLLPIESALGYTISQHLFLGSGHHLAVEGSSDFIYMQRLSEQLTALGKTGLDPRFSIIPVGGDANMPAFIALMGRRLQVSALVDGDRTSKKVQRILAAANANGVNEAAVVVCSDVAEITNADIEDLFEINDYLSLYNQAFDRDVQSSDLAQTNEPLLKKLQDLHGKFDHALPAHQLTATRSEFFQTIRPATLRNFEKLFQLLAVSLGDE